MMMMTMTGLFGMILMASMSVGNAFRHLQQQQPAPNQTLPYRANYSADFQALQDTFCIGDSPTLQVTCFGPSMTILGTSNETIECTQLAEPAVANGTTYECNNTCTTTECEDIYLYNEGGPSREGPYGSIWFLCEGNDVAQVDAALNYVGGNNGTCAGAAINGTTTRNLHIARLGVSCPVDASSLTREYVYDDTYFECNSLGSISFDLQQDPLDQYVCENGRDCDGVACDVMFNDLIINAFVPQFLDTCVESTVPLTTYPTRAPVVDDTNTGVLLTVRFEASWGNIFDSPTTTSTTTSSCSTANPAVTLSCENGASIQYVLTTATGVNCTPIGTNELSCTDVASNVVNKFSSVIFECSGSRIPTAKVTYTGSEALCVGNTETALIQHAVTLGMFCTLDTGSKIFFYNDLYFECADDSYSFDILLDYGFDGLRYVCSTSASFPIGSSAADALVIPDVAIVTDEYWLQDTYDGCFTIDRVPTAPTVSAPVPVLVPAPVAVPSFIAAPATVPTSISVPVPVGIPTTTLPVPTLPQTTTSPTNMPLLEPPAVPRGENPITQQSSSTDSKSPIGAIVGGIAGGIVIGVLVVGFLVYRKKGDTPNTPTTTVYSSSKPPVAGENHSTTGIGTERGHDPSLSLNTAPPMAASHTSHATGVNLSAAEHHHSTPMAVLPNPIQTSISSTHAAMPPPTPPANYEVNYKDQSRTVIGEPMTAAPMMSMSATPMPVVAVAVAMDVSGASGGSNTTRSEPPGRRIQYVEEENEAEA